MRTDSKPDPRAGRLFEAAGGCLLVASRYYHTASTIPKQSISPGLSTNSSEASCGLVLQAFSLSSSRLLLILGLETFLYIIARHYCLQSCTGFLITLSLGTDASSPKFCCLLNLLVEYYNTLAVLRNRDSGSY